MSMGTELRFKTSKTGNLFARITSAVIMAAIILAMIPCIPQDSEAASKETVKIAILSDIHYVSDENRSGAAQDDLKKAASSEMRMMSEIDLILKQALKDATGTDPDAMVVCGDLCSNGELDNEKGLAKRLEEAQSKMKSGSGIYVINGNHDINNSYGADFTGEKVARAKRTQASDFKEVYKRLGYSDSVRYYDAAPGKEVKNYGGLSYAAEIKEGVTLIALDTAQYSNNENGEYSNGQKTAGAVSDGLLDRRAHV